MQPQGDANAGAQRENSLLHKGSRALTSPPKSLTEVCDFLGIVRGRRGARPWFEREVHGERLATLAGPAGEDGEAERQRIVEALADSRSEDGLPASAIENRSGASRVTVFETLRALRAIRAVDQPSRGHYRLDRDDEVGAALATLASAARRLGDRAVDRPPRAVATGGQLNGAIEACSSRRRCRSGEQIVGRPTDVEDSRIRLDPQVSRTRADRV